MSRKLAALIIISLIILFFALGGYRYFNFEHLKASYASFAGLYTSHPILVLGGFFVLYIAITALSLPGAAILTLAAGALFGLGTGLVLVSFASSIGATLAFLTARYLLRDSIQSRFGSRLKAIDAGIAKDGALYLFSLRLVPAIPFFIINLVMGLTSLPTRTFYWVSQLGMLPGTFIYVNAGTQLAQLNNPADILSPTLLGSLLLLALFPWLAKWVINMVKRRQVYKNWTKPSKFDRNLLVIGGGSGGLVSAYIAATVKAKVTLVEGDKLGGDCLNYGCVPSKALIKSAKVAHMSRDAARFGVNNADTQIDFKTVMQRVQGVIKHIEPHDSAERYTGLGVEVLQGYATVLNPWTVEIALASGEKQTLTTANIILATGAAPFVPKVEGIEASRYVTSETLWERLATYEHPPERIVIVGGGAIGCELAQALARLGSQVTVVERSERLLVREDQELSEWVAAQLQAAGVQVLTQAKWLRCEQNPQHIIVQQADQELTLPYNELMCALGRKARLTGFGLENLGIDTTKPLEIDEYLTTLYPNIYAAGDVVGSYQFTHVASHQAWYATVNALFGHFKRFKVDYRVIPRVTFTDPEMARVGLNEQEAKAQNIPYEVTRYELAELDRAIVEGEARGWIKVLTVPKQDKILGATIVGLNAGELLAEFTLAMKYNLKLSKVMGTIHAYPTWAEANKYVAGGWRQNHKPEGLLKWVQKYQDWMRS